MSDISPEVIKEYLEQLTPKELIVYKIAKEHLGSSFDLTLSIGFKKWLKVNNTKQSE